MAIKMQRACRSGLGVRRAYYYVTQDLSYDYEGVSTRGRKKDGDDTLSGALDKTRFCIRTTRNTPIGHGEANKNGTRYVVLYTINY